MECKSKNVLLAALPSKQYLVFDSIDGDVYFGPEFNALGLVIEGEYWVTVESISSEIGDFLGLVELVRADDDPLLGKESEKHRG